MARSTTSELATRNGHANGTNGAAHSDIFNEAFLASELPLIGSGRPINRSTLVRTAQKRHAGGLEQVLVLRHAQKGTA